MNSISHKPYILSVDDEPINQKIVSGFLHDQYELAYATDGKECIDLVKHRRPDLILMDLHMPKLNGVETCRKIRNNPACRNIPIIFVSNSTLERDKRVSFAAGGDDYIVKPFSETALNSKISHYLNISTH